jgi:hypothetical protein
MGPKLKLFALGLVVALPIVGLRVLLRFFRVHR